MVHAPDQALDDTTRAAQHGADLVELRVDGFTHDHNALARVVEESDLPCIVTCRPDWEGGQYQGDEHARISLFEHLAQCARPPAYIDIELAAYQRSSDTRRRIDRLVDHPGQVKPTSTGLILSSHDFKSRPIDLYQRVEAMAAAPACRIMKLAWYAKSLRDNLEAFELLASHHKPTIALCMGPFGLPSRVLAKKFGALLTFASIEPSAATAEGQPTIDQLKNLYRWDTITPTTRVFGVIGYPVAHSASPAIHNAAFDAVHHDAVYLPLSIPPEYEHFAATVGAWLDATDLHFRGASVTIPHKENLLRFAHERHANIEPLAEHIGAANTLVRHDNGSLHTTNTDCSAAIDSVCHALGILHADLAAQRVAVIGAGGVARAVVAGFAQHGATVVVYNRTLEKAQALADRFNGHTGKVVATPLDKLCDSWGQIYINCTPLGMHPHTDATPVPDPQKTWGPGTVVFDTIYNPTHTRLLRDARAAGCLTISGLDMFIRQAALQFKLWTNQDVPLDVFRRILTDRLTNSGT